MQKPPVKVTVQFTCTSCGKVISGNFREVISYAIDKGPYGEKLNTVSFRANCSDLKCYVYCEVE